MNNLCPIKIDCPGTDFPVTNYSSEGGEPILPYLGVVWPPHPPPPPGSGFWATGCIGDCLSYTSQQEADECAQLQAALCDIGPNDGGGGGGTTPITPYYSGEASCTVNCPNGTVFTYYVNAGLFVALTQAQANAIAQAYACEKAQESLVCLGDLQRCWCLGDNRTSTIVPSGGVVVAWVVVSGSLPPGLVFSNGVVSGIPTTGGTYSITIRGYLANGSYAQRTYVLTALNITQTTLPNGTEGANYDQQLTVTGGTAPYTFTLIGGGFPLGVDITSAGLITGVVGEVGVFAPVIQVTDVTGCICSRVFSFTTEPGEDSCSTIAGESTQTWSFSALPDPDYEVVSALRLVNGSDYWGKNFEFDGHEGGALLVETSSDDTNVYNHCVYIDLVVDTVNMGTGEITFTGTHTWITDCFTGEFSRLMHKTGPSAGVQSVINSNTANTLIANNPATFAPGDEVMIIKYNSVGHDPFWIGLLPATERYHVEVGIQLQSGDENFEWTYEIRCQFALYAMTWRHGIANVVGFTPYGETNAGTYVRYLKCASTASSSGLLSIDGSDVRQWTGALSGAHEYNHAGTLLTQIQENLTDILPDPNVLSGNLSAWNAPGLPTIPTSGSMWGWYDDISGFSVLPVWAWTTPTSTTGTAALTGSGSGTIHGSPETYVWTTTLTGTVALTIPFDAQQGALAQFAVESTNDVRENTFNINWPPTWDVNHWEYTGAYLMSYNTEVYGLNVGRTYKVTAELIDAGTLTTIDIDVQTFVASATSKVLTGTIQASATDIILGQTLNMLKPVIEDITP